MATTLAQPRHRRRAVASRDCGGGRRGQAGRSRPRRPSALPEPAAARSAEKHFPAAPQICAATRGAAHLGARRRRPASPAAAAVARRSGRRRAARPPVRSTCLGARRPAGACKAFCPLAGAPRRDQRAKQKTRRGARRRKKPRAANAQTGQQRRKPQRIWPLRPGRPPGQRPGTAENPCTRSTKSSKTCTASPSTCWSAATRRDAVARRLLVQPGSSPPQVLRKRKRVDLKRVTERQTRRLQGPRTPSPQGRGRPNSTISAEHQASSAVEMPQSLPPACMRGKAR